MVKEETRKFVEENRELLEKIVKYGSPAVRSIALAFLLAVDLEGEWDDKEDQSRQ
jgi:hypothetical protein